MAYFGRIVQVQPCKPGNTSNQVIICQTIIGKRLQIFSKMKHKHSLYYWTSSDWTEIKMGKKQGKQKKGKICFLLFPYTASSRDSNVTSFGSLAHIMLPR